MTAFRPLGLASRGLSTLLALLMAAPAHLLVAVLPTPPVSQSWVRPVPVRTLTSARQGPAEPSAAPPVTTRSGEPIPVVDARGAAPQSDPEPIQASIEQHLLADGTHRLTLSFNAQTNRQHVVEYRDELASTNACDRWQQYPRAPHNTGFLIETNNLPHRFYRLRFLDEPQTGLFALLVNDTGSGSYDGLTSDPSITGQVTLTGNDYRLEVALDVADGPYSVLIEPLTSARHFQLSDEMLQNLKGGQLAEGPHTLHFRVSDAAGAVVRSHAVQFVLDTTPPPLVLALEPSFDSLPQGDLETTNRLVTLTGQTDPGLWVDLQPFGLRALADAQGRFEFAQLPLDVGANGFFAHTLDSACNEVVTSLTVGRPPPPAPCPFPTDLAGWTSIISPAAAGQAPGSITVENCQAMMREGSSFQTAWERRFTVPATPTVIAVTFELPAFDPTATGQMRDAFEIALLDAWGRPLTATIQGAAGIAAASVDVEPILPASPDALYNLSEGLPAVAAAGAASHALPQGRQSVRIDLSSLQPGSTARLVLRLVNNDSDTGSRVVLQELTLPAASEGLALPGIGVPAFSLTGAAAGSLRTPGEEDCLREQVVFSAPSSPGGSGSSQALRVFTHFPTFQAETRATDWTGPLPDRGSLPGGSGASQTVGRVRFSLSPPASGMNLGRGNRGDWTDLLPGADLAVDGVENLNVDFETPVSSAGFDLVEPTFGICCSPVFPFEDTQFEVTLKRGGESVGRFEFNAPNDVPAFIGVQSPETFDRMEIRDLSDGIDDEYFGHIYAFAAPVTPALYAINRSMHLVRIDPRNGVVLDVRPLQGLPPNPVEVFSLAYHPCEGRLYAFVTDTAGAQFLLRIDGAGRVETVNQIAELTARPATAPFYEGLVYARHLQSLVASQIPVGAGNYAGTDLGTLSPAGDFLRLQTIGRDNDALAYDSRRQLLYGYEGNDSSSIWGLDLGTGTSFPLPGNPSGISGVGYDAVRDQFVGLRDDSLVTWASNGIANSEIAELFPLTGDTGGGDWTALTLVDGTATCPDAPSATGIAVTVAAPVDGSTTPTDSRQPLYGTATVRGRTGTGGTNAVTLQTIFGEDVSPVPAGGPNQIPRPSRPNSLRARTEFQSRLSGTETESFESFPAGSVPMTLRFGSTTATLSGSAEIWRVSDPAGTLNGAYPGSGTNLLTLRPSDATFYRVSFDVPQAAFGFFATDVEWNRFGLVLIGPDGSRRPAPVPVTVPQGSGGSFYFGIIDPANPFVAVEFQNTGGVADAFGFDDLTVGTPAQVVEESVARRIVSVTVNATPVESLDPAGNYFTTVTVAPGRNRYEVVATDSFGLSVTNHVTILGSTCAQNLSALGELSSTVLPEYRRTSFHDGKRVVYADIALWNGSSVPVRAPFYLGVPRISDPTVTLLAPDGVSADGIPYYDFSATLPTGGLTSGQGSGARTLAFHNPNRVPFTYQLVVLGRMNQPPGFTSVPRLEAVVGRPYAYDAEATDPEGEAVRYGALQVPNGASLDPVTGLLAWTPTEPGSHEIRLQAADPLGALAEQRFLLTAIPAPSNRPPVFTSTPVTVARGTANSGAWPPGLVAWWRGERNTMDSVSGAVGSAVEGTGFAPGMVGDGFTIDGVSGGVNLGNMAALDFEADASFTFQAWIRWMGVADGANPLDDSQFILVANYDCTPTSQPLAILTTPGSPNFGSIGFGTRDANDVGGFAASPRPLNVGEWYHVAGVREVTPSGKLVHLYLNGVRVASEPDVSTANLFLNTPDWIGRRNLCGTFDAFNGSIDEVAVHNRALCDAEILAIYHRGSQGMQLPERPHACEAGYTYNAQAFDPDFDTLTYSLVDGPAGMTIDPANGQIRWSPGSSGAPPATAPGNPSDLPTVPGYHVTAHASLPYPTELAVDALGNVYVGHEDVPPQPYRLRRIAAVTRSITEVGPALDDPDTLIMDDQGLISGIPGSVLVGGYVLRNSSQGVITAVQPDGTSRVIIGPSTDVGNPSYLRLDSQGNLLWNNLLNNTLLRARGTDVRLVYAGDNPGISLAVAPDGALFQGDSSGTIRLLAENGSVLNPALLTGMGPSVPLAIGPGGVWGNHLYSIRSSTGELLAIDRSGRTTVVGTGFIKDGVIFTLAFGPDQSLYVSDYSGHRILRISPTPEALGLHPGEENVTVAVSDQRGGVAYQSYRICLMPAEGNRPPLFLTQQWEHGLGACDETPFLGQVEVLDPDGDPVTLRLLAAPVGLVFNPTNRTVTYPRQPTPTNPFPVVMEATDTQGGVTRASIPLRVTAYGRGVIRGVLFHDANRDGLRDAPTIYANDFEIDNPSLPEWTNVRWDRSPNGRRGFLGRYSAEGTSLSLTGLPGHSRVRVSFDLMLLGTPDANGFFCCGPDLWSISCAEAGFSFTTTLGIGCGIENGTGVQAFPDTWPDGRHGGGVGSVEQHVLLGYPTYNGSISADNVFHMEFEFPHATDFLNVQWGDSGWQGIDDEAWSLDNVQVAVVEGERGLAGWRVFVDANENGRLDPFEISKETDRYGHFGFTHLPPGEYSLVVETRPGFSAVGPKSRRIKLNDGEYREGINLGFKEADGEQYSALQWESLPSDSVVVGECFRYMPRLVPNSQPIERFELVTGPDGLVIDGTTGALGWCPTAAQVGRHPVVVRAVGVESPPAVQSFQITVLPPNSAPQFSGGLVSPAVVGVPCRQWIRAQDAEGSALTFSLGSDAPEGLQLDTVMLPEPGLAPASGHTFAALISWTPTLSQVGPQSVPLTVRDSDGLTTHQTFTVEVVPSAPNQPPAFTSLPRRQLRVATSYAYRIEAVDPNADALTFSLVEAPAGLVLTNRVPAEFLPAGMVSPDLNLLGQQWLAWTPSDAQLGLNRVHLQVSDGRGGVASQEFVLEVASTVGNGAPVVASQPPRSATSGQLYATTLVAEDPDDDPLLWRLVEAPQGMSIDPSTGTLRWLPSLDQLGLQRVVVEVRDALLATANLAWDVDVGCLNRPPQISSAPPTQANSGSPYRYLPRAGDPDQDALTWSFEGAPPAGMTVDATTGLVGWEPSTQQVGPHRVRLQVNDGRGGVATQDYVVFVSNQRANRGPVITTSPGSGVALGQTFTYRLQISDADGDPVIAEGLRLPNGATLIPTTTAPGLVKALLSWTPTEGQIGSQEFILAGRDPNGASTAQRFFVQVRANLPPSITSTPRTNAVVGSAYRSTVVAFDPDGDVLQYELTQSPPGMRIDERGLITWSPTANQAGEHAVTVVVRDPLGGIDVQSFPLNAAADTEAPQVALDLIAGLVNEETGQWAGRLGDTVLIRVRATDNVGVESLALRVGARTYPLGPGGVATVPVTTGGPFQLNGEARDAAGNLGTATRPIQFIDPDAINTVSVKILSPTNETRLQKRVPVIATLSSAVPIRRYAVDYAVAGEVDFKDVTRPGPNWVRLNDVTLSVGQTELKELTVGTFDPLSLLNDTYVIRVYAEDDNGLGWYEPVVVHVEGDLKFGEFRMEFTDLTVPLAGLPITVGRVYDTRLAGRESDFGHGWSLAIQDARIRESVPAERSFRPGTRVYLTGPDGRRLGFTFEPILDSVSFFGGMFRPRFVADPGLQERLEVEDEPFSLEGAGSIGTLLEALGPYNPSDYTLVTRDGTRYQYSQSTGLRDVTDLNANQIRYTRDGIFHYPAGATEPDQSIQFLRDARGRITHVVDPQGQRLTYGYDVRGDLRTFADQSNNLTRYAYDSVRPHFLTNIVDPFGKSALNLVYDSTGRLAEIRDAAGRPVKQDFDAERNTGTFTDARGNQTIVEFDDRGNELVRTIPGISTNRFTYDAENHLIRAVNGRGFATNFVYDTRGNVTRITDALTNVTEIAYNENNKPTAITNALQQVVRLQYSPSGDLTGIINHLGQTTRMGRDASGRLTHVVDALGHTNTFVYEGGCPCGRPGMVINPDGSFRRYAFDDFGRTNLVVSELGAETRYRHDPSGLLLSMEDALGQVTRYRYDGPRLSSTVDPLGRATVFRYDELGRTNQIINAEGGVVEFRYDANGNQTHVIDPVGNVTRFVYDSANRLINQIDTFGHTNHFAYDAAGNRILAIDRNGRKRTFAYDALNRMTNEVWWEGTTVVKSLAFAFNALGVQTSAADDVARYDYQYDGLNRLQRVAQTAVAGQRDFTLLYTYTVNGQVESVTDNWGVRVGSAYDGRNQLTTRIWQGPGVDPARVDFAYAPDGLRLRTDRYADLAATQRIGWTTNAYDRVGLTTNITHLGPTGAVLAKYDYQRDAAWQIRRWNINGNDSRYDYDTTGQLTNALYSAQPDESFRYDLNGNRIGGGYATGGNNQLLADGTYTYGYDPEGSLTSRTNLLTGSVTRYTFDHRNRLTRVVDLNAAGNETQRVEFNYDAMNRRVAKTVDGVVQRFLYNGDDSWADLDGSGAVTARYLLGARIDELIARQRVGDGRGWYVTDHLGSVRGVTGADGGVRVEFGYAAFGQPTARGDAAAGDRFLFTGREYDGETRLYYYRARNYDSVSGRFLSEDPIGFNARDTNLNRYVSNAPISMIDPSGELSFASFALTLSIGIITPFVLNDIRTAKKHYDTAKCWVELIIAGGSHIYGGPAWVGLFLGTSFILCRLSLADSP